jgi:hypothetical protein
MSFCFFQIQVDDSVTVTCLFAALEKVVREQRVLYGKHMDITSYDGKRETHNPAGGCILKGLSYEIDFKNVEEN